MRFLPGIFNTITYNQMRRLSSLFIVSSCLLTVGGCFDLFDSGSERIAGDYYLIWIDTHRNRSINKKDGEGVVPETVFVAGHNDRFIYAKQVPFY